MPTEAVKAYRCERLRALLNHPEFAGNKVTLGGALGYKGGAYVRQMIEGERPITEKLISKIDTLRAGKFRGWFDSEPEAAPAWPLRRWKPRDWEQIDPLDWAVMEDAAMSKLKELQAERSARTFVEPEKRDGTNR